MVCLKSTSDTVEFFLRLKPPYGISWASSMLPNMGIESFVEVVVFLESEISQFEFQFV